MDNQTTSGETKLPDRDYLLTEGGAWFTVKGFSVRIKATDTGVTSEIFVRGEEWDPIAHAEAYDSDL